MTELELYKELKLHAANVAEMMATLKRSTIQQNLLERLRGYSIVLDGAIDKLSKELFNDCLTVGMIKF